MIKKIIVLLGFFVLYACNSMRTDENSIPQGEEVTIVLLPDTQVYPVKYPEILYAQIDWIKKEATKISMVIQQGDLTQNNNDREWEIVRKAFFSLNNIVPYVLAVGNHDMGSAPGKISDTRNTDLFNQYFPFITMSKLLGFGGVFEENRLENTYYLLETGKHKWLVLTLEFGPRNVVLQWANDIVAKYPDRIVIVNTHSYMYNDDTRQGEGDMYRPQSYGIGKDTGADAVNDGEQIWQKLIKKHPNIRLVFSGHVLGSGVGNLVSINNSGHRVYQFLANYQSGVEGSVKGGNGYLRILNINFKEHTLTVKTYSPYTNEYLEIPGHNFKINHVFLETTK